MQRKLHARLCRDRLEAGEIVTRDRPHDIEVNEFDLIDLIIDVGVDNHTKGSGKDAVELFVMFSAGNFRTGWGLCHQVSFGNREAVLTKTSMTQPGSGSIPRRASLLV
jgi:hypothetical protein